MSREIKFRAWIKEEKRMVEVEIVDTRAKIISYVEKSKITNGYYLRSMNYDEIELMQYTGKKDKNSKEIYEGDIVVNSDGDFGYVFFRDGVYNVRHDVYTGYLFSWDYEIKGNIYKNLEMLNKKPV